MHCACFRNTHADNDTESGLGHSANEQNGMCATELKKQTEGTLEACKSVKWCCEGASYGTRMEIEEPTGVAKHLVGSCYTSDSRRSAMLWLLGPRGGPTGMSRELDCRRRP